MDSSELQLRRLEAEVDARYAEFVGTPGPDACPDEYRNLKRRQEIEKKCQKQAEYNRANGIESIMKQRALRQECDAQKHHKARLDAPGKYLKIGGGTYVEFSTK